MSLLNIVLWLIPEPTEYWIPIAGVVCGTVMVAVIVGMALFTKQRLQEMEHTLQLRRMEHERRMKELEIELARLNSGAPRSPAGQSV